jgi:hypothetical protein
MKNASPSMEKHFFICVYPQLHRSLIFFAYWDRRPKTETPKYQFVANYILVFFNLLVKKRIIKFLFMYVRICTSKRQK